MIYPGGSYSTQPWHPLLGNFLTSAQTELLPIPPVYGAASFPLLLPSSCNIKILLLLCFYEVELSVLHCHKLSMDVERKVEMKQQCGPIGMIIIASEL